MEQGIYPEMLNPRDPIINEMRAFSQGAMAYAKEVTGQDYTICVAWVLPSGELIHSILIETPCTRDEYNEFFEEICTDPEFGISRQELESCMAFQARL